MPGARLALALLLGSVFGVPAAADPVWVNGQAARAVIGQPYFTRQAPVSSQETIGAAAGIGLGGNRLFVAEGNKLGATPKNHRVVIYNNLSGFLPDPDAELPQADDDLCPVCVGIPEVVLGQTDFDSFDPALMDGMQNPGGVASDGVRLVVADTDNNRVLIWNTIPAANGTPPDVVIGQPDLTSNFPATSQTGMRGPQGVWIDSGRLFVADTQNSRVLIYNSIPTTNGAGADLVLGEPDFDTRPEPDLTQSNVIPSPTQMLDPVSVTVNNGRMFVADLGFSRVLIYLTVPTSNTFPADVVIGQPDFATAGGNNSTELCDPLPEPEPIEPPDGECTPTQDTELFCSDGVDNDCDGTIDFFFDDDCGPAFPRRCEATMSFPRFALSDGEKLYVADGGNDRVLIYNQIPLENGASADTVLGQPDFQTLEESDGAASLRAPTSLAHDGTNLFVADPFTRRVLVFTPGEDQVLRDGLVNGAAFAIPSNGFVSFGGDRTEGAEDLVTIDGREYKFTTPADGATPDQVRDGLMEMINNDAEAAVTGSPFVSNSVHATGTVQFGGSVAAGDLVRLEVAGRVYEAEAFPGDEPLVMVDRLLFVINRAEDPDVFAQRQLGVEALDVLELIAKQIGRQGNGIPYAVSVSDGSLLEIQVGDEEAAKGAQAAVFNGGDDEFGIRLFAKQPGSDGDFISIDTSITGEGSLASIRRSGNNLTGGNDARELPAGTLASIFGTGFAEQTFEAETNVPQLPKELGGVRVYVNGMQVPLYVVTPEQINFVVPFETLGTTVSIYVRRRHDDGTVTVSSARASEVARASPGLFAFDGVEPRRAIAVHGAGPAQGRVAISTTAAAGGTGSAAVAGTEVTVTINGRAYVYVTADGDTADTVRDGLVAVINAGDGDPEVTASAGTEGFFSARTTIIISGEIQAGDVVTFTIRGRPYQVTVQENDTVISIRNKMVDEINAGLGDPEVTARRLEGFDLNAPQMQVVARSLDESGNDIPFTTSVNEGSTLIVVPDLDDNDEPFGFLRGGQAPPVVILTAREDGRDGNKITFSASSSDIAQINTTTRQPTLCCGNDFFSLITEENPAIPGETIVIFGTGLGLTAPQPISEGVVSGQPIPSSPLFNVPLVADDFVSSQVARITAQVQFVGLMPGQVGVYQLNLRLNENLEDNPAAQLTIAQVFFISNVVTIPIKNLRPRQDAL